MSRKPSGTEFRRRAKEREKESHQSSSLLSSWLNVKNNYEEDDSRWKEERNGESAIAESEALVKTVKSREKSPTTHCANQDEIKVEFPISHSQCRTEAEQDSNSIAGTCHEAAYYNPGSGLSHTQCDFQFDFNDPGTWPTNISDTQRCFIVTQLMNGTKVEPDLSNSLRDGRKLTKEWFYKKLSNEQKVYRSWLSYSKSKNALFCIPCKLFSYTFSEQKVQKHSFLTKDEGFTQWKGFLDGSQFQSMTNEELKVQATKLANIYKEDFNKDELVIEEESFKYHALDLTPNMKTATPAGILSLIYKNGLQDAYPNITTALRIFLTIPVSVASNERCFTKLKIVKNYLRNLASQERLTNLSIITIEYGMVSKHSYDSIVNTFAAKKARKVKF